MTCVDCQPFLQAYLDHELDLRASLEVEAHLKDCRQCAEQYEQLRQLQEAVRGATVYAPSPRLLQRLRVALDRAGSSSPLPARLARAWSRGLSVTGGWRRWALAGSMAMALVVLWLVAVSIERAAREEEQLLREVVAAHVRSQQANHLTDIASSDQHTVKPWFQGKLDFSLPVRDWASEGFPLVGGRLDYLDNTPAAALVYKSGKHLVNLFVWPVKTGSPDTPKRFSERGFNGYHWTQAGMSYWLVSDLSHPELLKLANLVRGGT